MRKWNKILNVKYYNLGAPEYRKWNFIYDSYDSLVCLFWIFGREQSVRDNMGIKI